jgi:predicted transcriptional regulator
MGRRSKPRQLTPLELEIMKVLWEKSPATVQQVQQGLPGEPLAYTTVQTMLNVLHRKARVKRTLKNRAYEYEPALTREKAASQVLRDIVKRLFGGSPESLVMSLVESRRLTPEKLARLTRLVGQSSKAHGIKEGHGND